jgi:hypothetical protein
MGCRGTHSIAGLRPYWSTHARVPMQPSRAESTVCLERQGRAESSRYPRRVRARQTADVAELRDWVEGLRAAAHTARQEGNITPTKALDITRFEVYESYLDEDYTNNRAKRLMIKN